MAAIVTSNVTSGFFDSTENDRRLYTADEFSSIFDGLISDGVYENYPGGTRTVNNQAVKIPPFEVTKVVSGNDLVVTVGPGRAWFHHVWVLNATSTITLEAAHGTLPRVDTIYLRVNKNSRSCALACNTGTPSSDKTPADINSDDNNNGIYYYPIAYVEVPNAAASSSSLKITSAIGNPNPPANGKTPFVRAIVDPSMTLEEYVQSYISQVNQWKDDIQELITGTPSLEFVAEVEELQTKVDELEAATGGESGLTQQIEDLATNVTEYRTNTIVPLSDNVSTILGWFNTDLFRVQAGYESVDRPKKTICRYDIGAGTTGGKKPSATTMGNYIMLLSMTTNPNAKYNVQLALGTKYVIALRCRNGSTTWGNWKYYTFK